MESAAPERVLIHAPYGRDGALIAAVLSRSGITAEVCLSVDAVCEEMKEGAGAVILADEALRPANVQNLSAALKAQPSWSDLPLLIMTGGGEANDISRWRLQLSAPLGNVSLIERPLRMATLVSAVRFVLRARQRQYEIRDQLEELERANQAVRESEAQLRTLANAIPQLAWMANPDGFIFWYNQRWYEYTGTTSEEMEGWGWQAVHDPGVLPAVLEQWKSSLRDGTPFRMVFPLRRADGEFRPFLTLVKPVRDSKGQVVRWFGTNTDISDQRAAEEALRKANRELEEFAYVASHDLQEPLRIVNIYTQLLLRKLEGKLDDQTSRFATFVQEGVGRMEQLIRDLLNFSRTILSEGELAGTADLSRALAEAVSTLRTRIEETGTSVTNANLPTVCGDEAQLTQVFQNLISNAIKYRKPDQPPRIHISARLDGGEYVIGVHDNGIGFEQKHSDRIFGLFKRLHKDAFEGTGLGLAICKRIVERYSGRIWAESVLDGGSSFYFALPIAAGSEPRLSIQREEDRARELS